MRSFLLSAFSFLAFGVFCSAAPTPILADLPVEVPPVGVPAVRDLPTPDGATTLQTTLNSLVDGLAPLRAEISDLQKGDIHADQLAPILDDVADLLQNTVESVQNIVSITEVDVGAVVELVSDVLHSVFGVLGDVLEIVDEDVLEVITPLVSNIVALVVALLSAVLALVGSVVDEVVSEVADLVADLIPVILNLSAGQILTLLGITVQ